MSAVCSRRESRPACSRRPASTHVVRALLAAPGASTAVSTVDAKGLTAAQWALLNWCSPCAPRHEECAGRDACYASVLAALVDCAACASPPLPPTALLPPAHPATFAAAASAASVGCGAALGLLRGLGLALPQPPFANGVVSGTAGTTTRRPAHTKRQSKPVITRTSAALPISAIVSVELG